MTPREMVLAQIAHRETWPIPYTLPYEASVGERIDRYLGNGEWRGKLTPYMMRVAAVETDIREAIDDAHEIDGYGGIWRVDRRPWHLERPPLPEPTLEGYDFPTPERFLRPEWKMDAEFVCRENQDAFLVGELGWGLFERSWNLRGFENALMDAALRPAFYEEILDRLTELYLTFVEYTVDLPIDGVLFGDDWGHQQGVILGADRWRRFLKPRWARIYDAVHAAGKIVMSHSCGSVAEIVPDLIEIGLDVLESVQPEAKGMESARLKREFGEEICFWGCVGSQSTIPLGTPAEIKARVRQLCVDMGPGGGIILAPAKPLQPETPVENALALIEAFTGQGERPQW